MGKRRRCLRAQSHGQGLDKNYSRPNQHSHADAQSNLRDPWALARYVPSKNVFILLNDIDEKVYVYRKVNP
jgi:hypothetical protein